MNKIVFVSGMPRAGSTLLCNILNQNPRVYASATSGLVEAMVLIRNQWDKWVEHRAMAEEENETRKLRVLRSMMNSYHPDASVVIDKARGWLAHLEMVERVMESRAKVIVPVRNLAEILASFELLWRRSAGTRQLAQEGKWYFQMQTVEGRCKVWMREDQPVGLAYRRIRDAIHRGYPDRMCIVSYEALTSRPGAVMQDVYSFIGEEPFDHDFNHVIQVTHEDDRVHGIPDLHKIRNKVEPQPERWQRVLGTAGEKYATMLRTDNVFVGK